MWTDEKIHVRILSECVTDRILIYDHVWIDIRCMYTKFVWDCVTDLAELLFVKMGAFPALPKRLFSTYL